MIVEENLVLEKSLLRHGRPSGREKTERPHVFWKTIDESSIEGEKGIVSFDSLETLLELFISSDSIVSDSKNILYRKINDEIAKNGGPATKKAIRCGRVLLSISSKDRMFYTLRSGNKWGSIWMWDDDYSPSKLKEVVYDIIDGFCEAGWEISKVSPPARMFEELLLTKTNYGDFPDIISGAIDDKAAIRAWNCFRGGRMESARLGICDDVFDYDLNTAYFSVLRNLPSLRFVEWVDTNQYVESAYFGFCKCEVDIADSSPIGLCAVRIKVGKRPTRQYFPVDESSCWRTKSEIDLLRKSGLAKVNIIEGSWGIPKSSTPFAFYNVSRILERALKDKRCYNMAKVMCSVCWGKMASVSSPLFNPVYASHITAEIRTRITELALLLEKDLVAVAVDGLAVCRRLPDGMVSAEIGALKEKKIDEMISLSDYYRYNVKEPPRSWTVVDDGVLLNALDVKIPFGSTKRISPEFLSLQILKKEQFLLAPPTSEDVVELYMTTKDMVPWDIV